MSLRLSAIRHIERATSAVADDPDAGAELALRRVLERTLNWLGRFEHFLECFHYAPQRGTSLYLAAVTGSAAAGIRDEVEARLVVANLVLESALASVRAAEERPETTDELAAVERAFDAEKRVHITAVEELGSEELRCTAEAHV
jgi:hypothetical protein